MGNHGANQDSALRSKNLMDSQNESSTIAAPTSKWDEQVQKCRTIATEFEKALTALETLPELCGAANKHGCWSGTFGTRHNPNCQKLKTAVEHIREVLEACKKGELCAAPECLNPKKQNAYGAYRWEYCSEKCSAKVRSNRYRNRQRDKNNDSPCETINVTEVTIPISNQNRDERDGKVSRFGELKRSTRRRRQRCQTMCKVTTR
jgi:hypothetical protein